MAESIEDLKNKIADPNDSILFGEAVGCYEKEFYRAAYITAWISLVESLKNKLYKLSSMDDNNAKDAVKKIEDAELKHASTDKIIMDEAIRCELIEKVDESNLKYLWEQRCLFAHPYHLQPTKTDVEHIFTHIMQLSLMHDLMYNKKLLEDITQNIVEKSFYISSETAVIKEFAEKILNRTPQKLYPFFYKTLLSKIGEYKDDITKTQVIKKLRHIILKIITKTKLPLNNTSWAMEYRAVKFPYECMVGMVSAETWTFLPERIKEIFVGYVITEKDPQKANFVKHLFRLLIENNVLEGKHISKFVEYLDSLSFDGAIHYYGNMDSIFSRMIKELDSGSFNPQNEVIDWLNTQDAIKKIQEMSNENQFEIGRYITYSSHNSHYKSSYFVDDIESERVIISDYFKAGIAYGYVINKQNEVRNRNKDIIEYVKVVNDVKVKVQNFTYQKIFACIKLPVADEFDNKVFSKRTFEAIQSAFQDYQFWEGNNEKLFSRMMMLIEKHFEIE